MLSRRSKRVSRMSGPMLPLSITATLLHLRCNQILTARTLFFQTKAWMTYETGFRDQFNALLIYTYIIYTCMHIDHRFSTGLLIPLLPIVILFGSGIKYLVSSSLRTYTLESFIPLGRPLDKKLCSPTEKCFIYTDS